MTFFVSLIALLIAYYFIFWAFMHHKPLRRLKKPYRIACFTLGVYWTLFLFWVLSRVIGFDSGYSYYGRDTISELYNDTVNDCILSMFFSVVFLGIVHVFQNYVTKKDAEDSKQEDKL